MTPSNPSAPAWAVITRANITLPRVAAELLALADWFLAGRGVSPPRRTGASPRSRSVPPGKQRGPRMRRLHGRPGCWNPAAGYPESHFSRWSAHHDALGRARTSLDRHATYIVA